MSGDSEYYSGARPKPTTKVIDVPPCPRCASIRTGVIRVHLARIKIYMYHCQCYACGAVGPDTPIEAHAVDYFLGATGG